MIALALLVACGHPDGRAPSIETFEYTWVNFNHRVSYIGADVQPFEGDVAVIGGTSTTGGAPPLADTCDASTCKEFPVHDQADIRLDAAYLIGSKFASGTASATLDAGAAGATASIVIPLGRKVHGDVAVVLSSLVIDTDHATSDGQTHCYSPSSGWQPRRMAVLLGDPTLSDDGSSVSVDVTASFEAGNSLEDDRKCIDEIHEFAVAGFTVGVTAIAGDVTDDVQTLDLSASYTAGNIPFNPDPQPDPDPASRPLTLDATSAVLGWSQLDFHFLSADPDARGAYLRTFQLIADPTAGVASGHANGYSPGTQLSGFDYAFTGTLHAVSSPGATVQRFATTQTLPADLDAQGTPIVTQAYSAYQD